MEKATSTPFLIISSDTHAGLRTDQYREFLESRYHPQLDLYLQWQESTAGMRKETQNEEFVREWYEENDEDCGPAGTPSAGTGSWTGTASRVR